RTCKRRPYQNDQGVQKLFESKIPFVVFPLPHQPRSEWDRRDAVYKSVLHHSPISAPCRYAEQRELKCWVHNPSGKDSPLGRVQPPRTCQVLGPTIPSTSLSPRPLNCTSSTSTRVPSPK